MILFDHTLYKNVFINYITQMNHMYKVLSLMFKEFDHKKIWHQIISFPPSTWMKPSWEFIQKSQKGLCQKFVLHSVYVQGSNNLNFWIPLDSVYIPMIINLFLQTQSIMCSISVIPTHLNTWYLIHTHLYTDFCMEVECLYFYSCMDISKVSDLSRRQPKGSFFNSYYTKVYPWFLPYNAECQARWHQVSFLSLWYHSTWDWTLVSQTIGEHSTHLASGIDINIHIYTTSIVQTSCDYI